MKKLFILTVVCIAVAAGAYAGATEEQPAADTSTEATDPYAPIDGKQYHITWVGYQVRPIAEEPVMIQYWNEKFNVNIEVINIDRNKWFEILDLKLAAGEVAGDMGEVNEEAGGIRSNSGVVESRSQELALLADKLRGLVGQFKI